MVEIIVTTLWFTYSIYLWIQCIVLYNLHTVEFASPWQEREHKPAAIWPVSLSNPCHRSNWQLPGPFQKKVFTCHRGFSKFTGVRIKLQAIFNVLRKTDTQIGNESSNISDISSNILKKPPYLKNTSWFPVQSNHIQPIQPPSSFPRLQNVLISIGANFVYSKFSPFACKSKRQMNPPTTSKESRPGFAIRGYDMLWSIYNNPLQLKESLTKTLFPRQGGIGGGFP